MILSLAVWKIVQVWGLERLGIGKAGDWKGWGLERLGIGKAGYWKGWGLERLGIGKAGYEATYIIYFVCVVHWSAHGPLPSYHYSYIVFPRVPLPSLSRSKTRKECMVWCWWLPP